MSGNQNTTLAASNGKTAVYLVDAASNEIIMEITNGAVLDLAYVGARDLTIAVTPDGDLDAGSVYLDFDDGRETKSENVAPYALFGDRDGGDYYSGRTLFDAIDTYSVAVKVFSDKGSTGDVLDEVKITFGVGTEPTIEAPEAPGSTPEENTPAIVTDGDNGGTVQEPQTPAVPSNAAEGKTAVFLINARTNEVVMELTDGMVLDPDFVDARYLTIAVVPEDGLDAGSVYLDFDDGRETKNENDPPYALFGDKRGDYYSARRLFPEADSYTLEATFYSGKASQGDVLDQFSITFGVGTEPVVNDPVNVEDEPEIVEDDGEEDVAQPTPAPGATPTVTQSPALEEADEPEPAAAPAPVLVADPEPEPQPVPEPQPEPEPEPVEADDLPDPVAADDGEIQGGGTISVGDGGRVDVSGGRTSTLEHSGDAIASIRILDGPASGNVTVNPDNTMALVLSMEPTKTGNLDFTYEVTYDGGSTETVTQQIRAVEGSQEMGWGEGDFYNLEEGDDGNIIVEHGDNHREVYVSGSDDALTRADIAALEDLSVNQITGEWLSENPEYGGSPDMALAEDAGKELWKDLIAWGEPNSHHLLFESGYTYTDMDLLHKHIVGESELHPVYIGAYGEGDKPILNFKTNMVHDGAYNVVFQGLDVHGFVHFNTESENILFDNMSFTSGNGYPIVAKYLDGITIRNSDFIDVIRTENPVFDGNMWATGENRMQSIYIAKSDGVLMEDLFIDHTGWADGYDGTQNEGQAPSMFSQNIYIQHDNEDVTLRDTISMRAASFGAQMRSGGFVENVVFLDNNVGVSTNGGAIGSYEPKGNYTLFLDNLVTSAAHKDAFGIGALAWGLYDGAQDTALVGNIITHAFDPNNLSEFEYKLRGDQPISHLDDPYYDDTIIHNWYTARLLENNVHETERPSVNIDGLDTDVLDQTTIQLFGADLLGTNLATIEDFATYQELAYDGDIDGAPVTADDILTYFQSGFGFDPDEEAPTIMRFIPDDRGDGIRWDNPLNWSGDEHVTDGDSVDLAGNWVRYDGTLDLDTLDFGDGGTLIVDQGKLTVDDMENDGDSTLSIDEAGQVWVGGYSDDEQLEIEVDGGRFANTGKFDGLFEFIARDGQSLLGVDGAHTEVSDGSTLSIEGSDAKVGFDGTYNGVSILEIGEGGTLDMTADSDGFATIEEFRSGHFDQDTPEVLSAFDMGEGSLLLDITALRGKTITETLIDVDEMVGSFDDINIVGLSGNQDATLTFDYDADTVTLSLVTGGKGAINIVREGYVEDMEDTVDSAAIWNVLTEGHGTYEEQDDDIQVNGSEYDEDDILAA